MKLFAAAHLVLQTAKKERIPVLKLHALLFYCRVWHEVWTDEILFDNPIHATNYGVQIPDLQSYTIGYFARRASIPIEGSLSDNEQESIKVIVANFGHKSIQWLNDDIRWCPLYHAARAADNRLHFDNLSWFRNLK